MGRVAFGMRQNEQTTDEQTTDEQTSRRGRRGETADPAASGFLKEKPGVRLIAADYAGYGKTLRVMCQLTLTLTLRYPRRSSDQCAADMDGWSRDAVILPCSFHVCARSSLLWTLHLCIPPPYIRVVIGIR